MTVVEAIERLGASLGGDAAGTPEFAAALALARELDSVDVSATAKAACARSLGDCLERLRAVAPEPVKADKLDELSRKRGRRSAA